MKASLLISVLLSLVIGCAGDPPGTGGQPSDPAANAGTGAPAQAGSDSPTTTVGAAGGGGTAGTAGASGGATTPNDPATGSSDPGGAGSGSAGGTGGTTGGTSGSAGGTGGSTGGTSGSTGGTSGSTGGTSGSTAGTSGSTGGTSGSTAGTSGSTGGTSGSTGGTSGSTGGTSGSTGGTSGSTAGASGTAGAGGTTRDEFCMGTGPAIKVPGFGGGQPTCTGTIASELFTNALCTCENTNFAGYLRTRSWSGRAGSTPVAQGAAVGINGYLLAGSYVDAGGTLRVQGNTTFGGYVNVGGDLMLEDDVTLLGNLDVGRNAWFQNDASITAGSIGGDLHTQPGHIEPPFWFAVGGQRTQSTFDLDTPCLCDDQHLLDIDAIVDDGEQNNDNADPSVNLDPGSLTNLIGDHHVELPCGRFFVNEISGIGHLELVVKGRTALYVGGDVAVTGYFDVEIQPGAELDLFVRGNMLQIGYGKFGDVNHPASVRVYVGGAADILYLGYQPFGGNLYAPKARLWSDGFVDVRGSLFVRELDAGSYIKVDYDTDILDQGDDDACEPPPVCTDICLNGCGATTSCFDGACGKCVTDADCCAPLVCYLDGSCGELAY